MKQHTVAALVMPGDKVMIPSIDSEFRTVNKVRGNMFSIWFELETERHGYRQIIGHSVGIMEEVVLDKSEQAHINSFDELAPGILSHYCGKDMDKRILDYAAQTGKQALDEAKVDTWKDFKRDEAEAGEPVPVIEAFLLVRGKHRLTHKAESLTKDDMAAFEKIGFTIYPLVKYVAKR
ncbi:hypothetical protein vBSlqSZDD2_38 [Serratia phage vB_SlqS_ZDD2]|nr:hypothetical protein vBSlqSZDD2_38 [Serratia phage vB_SlqS_ZDD2]